MLKHLLAYVVAVNCIKLHGHINVSVINKWLLKNDTIKIIIITDHNECGDNNGGCSHECVNMLGTHQCECPTGYALLPNKLDCIKIGIKLKVLLYNCIEAFA